VWGADLINVISTLGAVVVGLNCLAQGQNGRFCHMLALGFEPVTFWLLAQRF
jgi:hypothetical protein